MHAVVSIFLARVVKEMHNRGSTFLFKIQSLPPFSLSLSLYLSPPLSSLSLSLYLVFPFLPPVYSEEEEKKAKTYLEALAEQRDYRRRRQSYRAKNVHITKRSATEVSSTDLLVFMSFVSFLFSLSKIHKVLCSEITLSLTHTHSLSLSLSLSLSHTHTPTLSFFLPISSSLSQSRTNGLTKLLSPAFSHPPPPPPCSLSLSHTHLILSFFYSSR